MTTNNDTTAPKICGHETPVPDPKSSGLPRDAIEAILEKLAPDEDVGPPETFALKPNGRGGYTVARDKSWSKCILAKRMRFRGYQPGSRYQDQMKRRCPDENAPLDVWTAWLINCAKADWSEWITEDRTERQFVEWLPHYLDEVSGQPGHPKQDPPQDFLSEIYGMPSLAEEREERDEFYASLYSNRVFAHKQTTTPTMVRELPSRRSPRWMPDAVCVRRVLLAGYAGFSRNSRVAALSSLADMDWGPL